MVLPHAASGDFDPESPRRNTLTGEVGPSSLPPQLTSVQHPNAPFAPPGGAPGSRIPPPPRGPVPFVPQLPQSTRLPTPGFMSAGGLPVPLAPPSAAWKPPPSLTQPSVSRTGSGASNGTPVASLVPAHPLQPQPQQQQYEYGQYSMEAVAEVPEPLAPSGMAYFNPAYNNPVDEAVPQEQHAAQEPPQAGAWEAPSGFDPGQESMHQQQQQQYHGEYQGADQQLAPQDHAWGDVYGSNDMLPAVYGGETGEEQHAAWGGVPPVMPGGVPVKKLPPPAVSFESPLKAKFAKRVPGKSTLPPPVQRTGSTGAAILPGLPRPPAPAAPPAAAPGFGHGLGGWEGSSVASAPAPDASEGEVNQQYGQQYEQYDDQPVPAEDVFPAPVGFGAPPAAPPAAFPTFAKPINVSRVDSGASNSTPRPFEQLAPPPMGAPGGLLQPSSAKPGGMLPTPQPRGSADGPPAVFKPMVPGSPGSGKAAAIPGSPGMGRLVPPAPLGGPSQEGPKTQQQNASTRRRRRRGGFCSRLLLLLTIGLICSAFISAGSTVLALTVAANLMHSAVAGIRHLPTSAQGFAAWRQQALGPGLDNAVNHMTGVYQSEWFRTLESLECEDLKPTCQARRWTVHKARVGKVLGLDAWRVAKEHAPLAWENIVLPSAAFARHQGVLAWQQLKELKNEAGRAALVASVRRSAQDAKRLGLDLVEWAHCVVPHVSTSGWKSLDQVAGSCWQEKMGHYLGDGETTPPAAGGDDAGAAAHAAAPALKEDVLEEKGTDIEEKEEAPLSSPVDSGNAGNEDVSSTGDGKDTTMPDAVPEVPKEEASQAPAAPVAPDDVPSNATAPRKEEERDAPDVGAPAEDSKAAFEVVEDTFKQEIDPIEMDIEGSAPLNTSATPLASSAETEPSSPEDVTVDALPVAQPEAVDEVPLKAAPAPKEPLIKVANASAPVPVRVPATPAKVSEEPMLEEEATETPSAVNATAPEEVLEDPMLEEKAPEAPGEVNATSPVPSNATEAEEKVDVRPPGASSGSIQEVVPVAGAKEEEAASIEVGGSTGDVQRLYEEEYVVGRDGTADGEPRAEVNPGSKPVGEIKPRDEDLGSTSHGQDIKEKQEEGVEKSEGDEHDEQYDDYLPEMWDEEESYGEDDFHSIDDSEALNGGTEVLATEKQEPAAVNEVTASEETEEPKAAAVDEVNASEEPKEQEAAAVEVMESPEEQIVPVAQQSPALDEAAIEPASQPAPKPAAGEEEVHVKEGPSAMEKFSSQATELAQTLKEAAGEALAAAQWRMQTLTSQAMVHTAVVREYLAANGGTVVTAIVAVGATSAAFLLGSASARRARAVPAGAAAVVEPVTPRRAARAAPALEKEPEGEEGEGEPTTAWKSAKSGSVLGNIFGSGSKAPGEQATVTAPARRRGRQSAPARLAPIEADDAKDAEKAKPARGRRTARKSSEEEPATADRGRSRSRGPAASTKTARSTRKASTSRRKA